MIQELTPFSIVKKPALSCSGIGSIVGARELTPNKSHHAAICIGYEPVLVVKLELPDDVVYHTFNAITLGCP